MGDNDTRNMQSIRQIKISSVTCAVGTSILEYVTHVFVSLGRVIICRLYKLTLLDRARFTLQLTLFQPVRILFRWPW